jgi:Asp/Glu/hydantoin racemase
MFDDLTEIDYKKKYKQEHKARIEAERKQFRTDQKLVDMVEYVIGCTNLGHLVRELRKQLGTDVCDPIIEKTAEQYGFIEWIGDDEDETE